MAVDSVLLPDNPLKAAVLVAIPAAILSILGSCTIMYLVVKSPNSQRDTYKRILFAMSVFDIISSLNFALLYFLLPTDYTQNGWTVGNSATCSASGFLVQLGVGSGFFYYGMLSFYFCLTIRSGVSREKMATLYEPWMHLIAIGYPLATAIAGVALDVFGEYPTLGCWFQKAPSCSSKEGEEQEDVVLLRCQPDLLGSIFTVIPWAVIGSSIVINNVLIYLFVRNTIQRTRNRTFFAFTAPSADDPSSIQFTVASARLDSSTRNTTAAVPASSRSRMNIIIDPQANKIQAVATQCFLYVGVFVLTYIWSLAIFMAPLLMNHQPTSASASTYGWLLVIRNFFLALAGFWNLIVYLRPRYLSCRDGFPNETKWWAARRALFGDTILPTPLLQSSTIVNNNNNNNNNVT